MLEKMALTVVVLGLGLVSSAAAQEDRSVVFAYQTTTTPPVIDGEISPGEWDAAGPPIIVNPDSPNAGIGTDIAEDVYGGAADLSYQFRVMWAEPWTAYFLVEITDDIAMDSDPRNLWERDQVELFLDGDDLFGSDDLTSFEWWASPEIYGKFGVSREGTFEGNPGVMSQFEDDIFADEFGFLAAAAVASETGNNADYLVEYAVSLEPMFIHGTFEGTETENAGQIVADSTVVKYTIAISDDDNFDTGNTERSHTLTYYREKEDGTPADWRDTSAFADLTFVGPFGAAPQLKAGDADRDLDFDQLDLVQVQVASKYLSGQPATWGEGDWNGAPGGSQDAPPAGNGFFDQLDIIAALGAGTYLSGPYAAIAQGGQAGDGQTSVGYDTSTGEVWVDAPAGTDLTSINIDSAAGIFTGDAAANLGGSFDNDADNNIFKATFGSSFGTLSFGNVAQPGLSEEFVAGDLTVVGSLAGGGDLGAVDLIYVPEPSSLVLGVLATLGIVVMGCGRSRGR